MKNATGKVSKAGKHSKEIGFTLIEMMIAVVIIAIIAAIALPSYNNYIERSRTRTAGAALVSLSAAVENSFQRTLAYPANIAGVTGWQAPPASELFTYSYTVGNPGYTVTATGTGVMTGCSLTLNDLGVRGPSTLNSACGLTTW